MQWRHLPRVWLSLVLFASLPAIGAESPAPELEPLWQCGGFLQPESVVFDNRRQRFYVSNMIGAADAVDGRGSISLVSDDGKMLQPDWIAGLNAPKGMAISHDLLYVADIHDIVVISLARGQIVQRLPVPGSVGLNDVAASPDGRVFVTDVFDNAIYVIDGEQVKLWLRDSRLLAPNGVTVDARYLYVGSWGHITEGVTTDAPGHVLAVDKRTRLIEPMGLPVGNIDGLEIENRSDFLLTDFMRAALIRLSRSGTQTVLAQLPRGAADMTYVPSRLLVVIPQMLDNRVVAFRLPSDSAQRVMSAGARAGL